MSRTAEDTDRTLWMGDLSPEWDSAYITEAFARMGEEVTNVKIVFDKYTTKQAGYCFVEFPDQEAARRAMLHINGKIIPKSKPAAAFNLSFANSPNAPYTEYNLFVNNVPHDMDDAALFLIFGERYRSCRGAKVYRNSDGSSKGLGFVRFSDQTDQQRALLEMNKYRVDGKQLLLKLAQPKYRAPRQARQQHPLAYDASTYYAHAQGAANCYDANVSYQQQAYGQGAQYAYSVGNSSYVVQPMYYPVVEGGAIVALEEGGVEPVDDETAEASNDRLLANGEEFYEALERNRWSKVICDIDMTENRLLRTLSS
uniref:tRNA selenocysteine 1-associated protein 1 n=1 Tax=Ascaris suum TaxID=6253 RepID=F1LBW7_ASCSU